MSEFEINITRLQGQNLAMDVLASSSTAQFLIRAIGQGIWSLAEIDGGVDKLNRFLASEGYTLVKSDAPNKPTKAAKNVDLKAWAAQQTEAPKVEKVRKVKSAVPNTDHRERKSLGASKWPEAKESGEAVKALITKHHITDRQLMNEYEFDEDEIKFLHNGEYMQIGRRILFELLTDMRKMLEPDATKASNPNRELGGMTRRQMGEAISKLLADNTWLTDDELIHNYEFGVNEVIRARRGDWLKFSGAELNSIYKDLVGGINERAIQIPTTPQGYKA